MILKVEKSGAVRIGASVQFNVTSRGRDGRKYCYTVAKWVIVQDDGSAVIRMTCTCKGARFGHLCYHIKHVVKMFCPRGTIWKTEADALRQKKHRSKFLFGPDPFSPGWANGGVAYITEPKVNGKYVRAQP